MKINFKYNKEKDIWCLLNYGRGSSNSNQSTKVYEKIIADIGNAVDERSVAAFIDRYLTENSISVENYREEYQNDWDSVSNLFSRKSEKIFGVGLKDDIDAYLSINNRCPLNILENYFFVSVPTVSARKTVMHELWHFYTWYKFGVEWQDKLGKEKYNDIKESLTVLLNVEFKDLLKDVEDKGYSQHQELRKQILYIWQKEKNIEKLWKKLVD